MSNISYQEATTVFLDSKYVGDIKPSAGGYRYFPKGKAAGGEWFLTVAEVKASLEDD